MHETCETVTIKTENGPVVINKDDYDPKAHALHKKPGRPAKTDESEPEAE